MDEGYPFSKVPRRIPEIHAQKLEVRLAKGWRNKFNEFHSFAIPVKRPVIRFAVNCGGGKNAEGTHIDPPPLRRASDDDGASELHNAAALAAGECAHLRQASLETLIVRGGHRYLVEVEVEPVGSLPH